MKRVISFVLALVLVCTLLPSIPLKAAAAESAPEYKKAVLSINWTNIKTVGKQNFSGQACSCYALAYCTTLLDNKAHHFSEYNQNGNDEYNAYCEWSNGGFVGYSYHSDKEAFKRLYRDIVKGTPIVAKVIKPGTSSHFVTVVGFQNITSFDNLSTSNFLIIDPGTSKFEIQNMGSLGYSLNESSTIYYNYTGKTIGFSTKIANNPCDLTFNTNGGSTISSITTAPGSAVTIPSTVPAKFGYDFSGWATSATGSATYQPGDTITISQDTTLYAVWYKTSYRVSTSLSGTATIKYPGVGRYFSFTVDKDATYGIKGLTGSEGYVDSVAWLYDSEGYGIATDDNSGGNGQFKIEAELETGEEYILYMKAYDSSFTGWFNWRISALEEQVVGTTIYDEYMGTATISEPGSMDCYLFTPTVSDTYVIYSFGDTDSVVYLYDSNGTQIASDDQGGDGNNFRLTYYMTAGTIYQFGIKLFDSSATGVVDFAFGKVYNLTYDANGGSNAPASQECDFGRALSLSNTAPTRDGYMFLGWAGSADASYAMWQPGQSINIGADTTLYAVWQPYISGSGQAVISTPGSTVCYTFTAPNDRTYVIYSTSDLDSRVYLYDSNWVLLASDDDGGDGNNFRLQYDMTAGETYYFEIALYDSSATGTVDYMFGRTYKVSYDANGGSGAPTEQYRDFGNTITLSSTAPIREGYTFLGWATEPDASSAEHQPGDEFVCISDTTLYAVWEICEHHTHFVSLGGTPSTLSTGTLTLTCASCSAIETVTLPKLNTTDYTYSVVRAATCTTQGIGRYTWKDNTYGEWFFNVTIPMAGHDYGEEVTAPTCTEQGYTTYTCGCGDTYVDNYLGALGHSFTDYRSNGDATCTKDGTETAKCDRCNETHTQTAIDSKLGHNYDYQVQTEPTMHTTGILIGTCNKCSKTQTVTLPMLTTTDYGYHVIKAATCTTTGKGVYEWKTTTYGDLYFDIVIPAYNHVFTRYKSNNDATCLEDGTETAKCDRCNETHTRVEVGSAGHKHKAVVTAPTCTEQGYTTHTCECGDSFVDSYVPALDHSFTNYVSNNDATYDADGTKTAKCDRCDETHTVADPGSKKIRTGWHQIGGKWYYFDTNGVMATNTWKKDSNGWCWLTASGAMATNQWVKDSKGWCYVGANGYCWTNRWAKDSIGWIWLDSEGSMTKSKWIQDGGKWYYLDANGYMVTSQWRKDSNGWCWLTASGAMATNQWVKDSKGWCYVGANGYCWTNRWAKDSIGWIWLDSQGSMTKSQWLKDGNNWYYLNASGYMVTGRVTIGGIVYNFASNGVWIP